MMHLLRSSDVQVLVTSILQLRVEFLAVGVLSGPQSQNLMVASVLIVSIRVSFIALLLGGFRLPTKLHWQHLWWQLLPPHQARHRNHMMECRSVFHHLHLQQYRLPQAHLHYHLHPFSYLLLPKDS
jgi:hypothetical protein